MHPAYIALHNISIQCVEVQCATAPTCSHAFHALHTLRCNVLQTLHHITRCYITSNYSRNIRCIVCILHTYIHTLHYITLHHITLHYMQWYILYIYTWVHRYTYMCTVTNMFVLHCCTLRIMLFSGHCRESLPFTCHCTALHCTTCINVLHAIVRTHGCTAIKYSMCQAPVCVCIFIAPHCVPL